MHLKRRFCKALRSKMPVYEEVVIDKLVHGGQGIGKLENGKTAFVWNALPGEKVKFIVSRNKKNWCEGTTVEVIEKSDFRIEPREPEIFTATSPWQVIKYSKEADYKQQILNETFLREGIEVSWLEFYQDAYEYGYRNKMEYNFWFFNETQKVSLALHKRGTHQKIALEGSELASKTINSAGEQLIKYINDNKIEARPLKSVILRSDSSGRVGVCLFVNDRAVKKSFRKFNIPNSIFEIVYSNPKSPASISTEDLLKSADSLKENIIGTDFIYSTRSFFQVNIPVYEKVLEAIKSEIDKQDINEVVDLYSGVGSIGLSVVGDNKQLTMIEISQEATDQAKINMTKRTNCKVVTATAESALDYITGKEVIILDPPRAGLHEDVVNKIVQESPKKIVYLSCNPSTQARDIKYFVDIGYTIDYAKGYNFFPRTPHIESLIILSKLQ